MTPEAKQAQAEARKATDAANRAKWDTQQIKIGAFKLQRHDEVNWRVDHGKDRWHYGTLISALQALPRKIMNEAQFNTLEEVLGVVQGIEKEVERLYYTKFKLD